MGEEDWRVSAAEGRLTALEQAVGELRAAVGDNRLAAAKLDAVESAISEIKEARRSDMATLRNIVIGLLFGVGTWAAGKIEAVLAAVGSGR